MSVGEFQPTTVRKVTSMPVPLAKWRVTRVYKFKSNNLSIPWFEEEVESVAAYLNADYYKFEIP